LFLFYGTNQALKKHNFFFSITFLPKYLHFLRHDGINGTAGIIGLNGQFPAETAIDEHAQLYLGGTAKIEQGVQRGPDGAAGVQYIVDQYHILIFYAERNIGVIGYMDLVAEIIAVKSNIQLAVLHFIGRSELPDHLDHLIRYKNASWLYANKNRVIEIDIILQYLVTKPPDYNGQLLFI
jgi:hypothetical protein